jgi:hypothetical protein
LFSNCKLTQAGQVQTLIAGEAILVEPITTQLFMTNFIVIHDVGGFEGYAPLYLLLRLMFVSLAERVTVKVESTQLELFQVYQELHLN